MSSQKVARYTDGGNYDTIKLFFDEKRAVNFSLDVGGYIASYLCNGDSEMWEVRYMKRRAL